MAEDRAVLPPGRWRAGGGVWEAAGIFSGRHAAGTLRRNCGHAPWVLRARTIKTRGSSKAC
eukprot:scaffold49100_cov48-Phaeocystis_antarctica.AAC.1